MDLSSSATQRSNATETLAIQPGSVRAPMMDAAKEFARHLAENSQMDNARRRDDRPLERRERPETRERASRDEKAESRKTAHETDEPSQDKVEEPAGTEAVVQLETTHDDEAALVEAPSELPNEALEDTIETEGAIPAEEIESSPVTPVPDTAEAEIGAQAEIVAAATVLADPDSTSTAPTEAKPAQTGNTAPTDAKKNLPPVGATAEQPAGTDTPDEIASAKPAAVAPKSMTPAGGQQAEGESPAAAMSSDSAPKIEAITGTKPAKGLGQTAAEQLADKKTDAKQATAQANAAPQSIPANQQNQRPAGVTPAPAQTAIETSGLTRSSDLPPTGASLPGNANGNAATVRIGTLPGQSQPTQLPATTIALQMARNLQKGISRFDIRLDPPEMGRIDIRMEVRKDGHVAAHLMVDRPETLDLLQRDARALQQALNNVGLQADGDSLNFTLRDQNSEPDRQNFAGGERGGSSEDLTTEEPPLAPVYNVNLSANGGVDIRV